MPVTHTHCHTVVRKMANNFSLEIGDVRKDAKTDELNCVLKCTLIFRWRTSTKLWGRAGKIEKQRLKSFPQSKSYLVLLPKIIISSIPRMLPTPKS